MFLVPTRSPRCVEHFRVYPDEFRPSNFRKSEKEVKRRNKLKKISPPTKSVLTSLPIALTLMLVFFLIKWDPHVPFYFFLVRFSPETIYFVPVSISFIIIEYSLNICHFFLDFSKIPFSGFTLNPSPRNS